MPRLKLPIIPKCLSTHLSPILSSFPSPSIPPTTSFQILSDLHLEATLTPPHTYETFHVPPRAPYLILAGDVGLLTHHYPRYLHFLREQAVRFKHVFVVLGNHEFYRSSRAETLAAAARLEAEEELCGRVSVLHRKRVDLRVGGELVSVLGVTLNTRVPESAAAEVALRVADFKMIEGWSVDAHNTAHEEDLAWLKSEVAGLDGRKAVIVSHHAPRVEGTSRREFEGSKISSAFSVEVLEEVVNVPGGEGVGVWAFGHTHHSADFWVKRAKGGGGGRVRVVANQRGYFDANEGCFDVGLVVGI